MQETDWFIQSIHVSSHYFWEPFDTGILRIGHARKTTERVNFGFMNVSGLCEVKKGAGKVRLGIIVKAFLFLKTSDGFVRLLYFF